MGAGPAPGALWGAAAARSIDGSLRGAWRRRIPPTWARLAAVAVPIAAIAVAWWGQDAEPGRRRPGAPPTAASHPGAATPLPEGGRGEPSCGTGVCPPTDAVGAVPPPDPRMPYTADKDILLSLEKRKEIWEEEDRYFQLTSKPLAAWDAGLLRGDVGPYLEAAATGFRGRWAVAVAPPAFERHGAIEWAFLDGRGEAEAPLGGDAFAAALLALRREFATTKTAHWAVTSLRPLDRAAPREHGWEGRIQVELRGTLPSGARAETNVKCRIVTGPLPRDLAGVHGWLLEADVLSIRRVRAADPVDGPGPLLEDVTAASGLPGAQLHDNWVEPRWIQVTGGVFVEDVDRDGILDVLVTDVNRTALMKGLGGGRFVDRTREALLPTTSVGAALYAVFADFDGDGWPDLVLGDRVWRNTRDGRFEELGDRAVLPLPVEVTNLVAADYDADGKVDLYVCTAGGRGGALRGSWIDDRDHTPNRLLRNLGGFRFQDVTEATGTGDRGACFTAVWFDHDRDRFPDLYVANEVGQNALYLNDGSGRFRKVDPDGTRFGGLSMGADAGDVDGDGRPDLYVANMYSKAGTRIVGMVEERDYPPGVYAKVRDFVTGNRLYVRGDGRGGFTEVAPAAGCAAAGWAYGVRMLDLDGDGALDLYSTCGHKSVTRTEPDG